MRKLILSAILSVDGYMEGPGGDVMALPMDASFDRHNLERLRSADVLVLGARTYTGLKAFWPEVAKDPTFSPPVQADPSFTDLHREIAERNDQARKVVVSDTLTVADTTPWTESTTIVPRTEAVAHIAELKEREGGDLLMFGSRTLGNHLLKEGLVDELHLVVGAVLLGGGAPAFPDGRRSALRLMDVHRPEDSDNLVVRYEVVRDT